MMGEESKGYERMHLKPAECAIMKHRISTIEDYKKLYIFKTALIIQQKLAFGKINL